MEIGVVADVVFLQLGNYVAATAPLQNARLFADQFECGADAALGEHVCQPFGRVVVRGQQVVLGIEPEDDLEVGFWGGGDRLTRNQSEKEQPNECPPGEGFHGQDV